MLIFLTESPPPFSHIGSYCSDTRTAQRWTGKKAEINFAEGQTSIFFQAKHDRYIA